MNHAKTYAPRVLNENPESLHLFESTMRQYPTLTPQRESELVSKMLAGDSHARETLILSNLRLAFKYSREWVSDRLPLEDLVSAAIEGLICSIDKYNPSKGERIITYAIIRIKEKLQKYSEDNRSVVALSHRNCETSAKVRKIRQRFEQEFGDVLDEQELIAIAAKELGCDEYKLAEIINAERPLSFESTYDDDDEDAPLSLGATYGTDDDPETIFIDCECYDLLEEGLSRLPERTARVLTLLFGLGGREEMKVKDIAALLNVCEETINNERKRGLKLLKDYLNPRMVG